MAITRNQAEETATGFLGFVHKHLGLSPQEIRATIKDGSLEFDPKVGHLWTLLGNLGEVGIAADSDQVVLYQDSADLTGIEATVSMERAEQEMRRFLGSVFRSFDERRFKLTEAVEEDGCFHFTLDQIRQRDEVSIFHNFVAVSLRADTPRVVTYDRSCLDFVRKHPPGLSESEAADIVQRRVGPGGKIVQMDLCEHPAADLSRAVTVWAASVVHHSGGIETLDMVMIDADSGDVVAED